MSVRGPARKFEKCGFHDCEDPFKGRVVRGVCEFHYQMWDRAKRKTGVAFDEFYVEGVNFTIYPYDASKRSVGVGGMKCGVCGRRIVEHGVAEFCSTVELTTGATRGIVGRYVA